MIFKDYFLYLQLCPPFHNIVYMLCVCVCVCVCVYLLGFVILNKTLIQGTLVCYLETTYEELGYSLLLNRSCFSTVFQ